MDGWKIIKIKINPGKREIRNINRLVTGSTPARDIFLVAPPIICVYLWRFMSLNFDVRQPPDWLLDAGGCRMNDCARSFWNKTRQDRLTKGPSDGLRNDILFRLSPPVSCYYNYYTHLIIIITGDIICVPSSSTSNKSILFSPIDEHSRDFRFR
jgi:hypothetical protein